MHLQMPGINNSIKKLWQNIRKGNNKCILQVACSHLEGKWNQNVIATWKSCEALMKSPNNITIETLEQMGTAKHNHKAFNNIFHLT